MPRQPNIKWSSADRAEVNRIRKNFNAKVTRMEKAGVDPSIIPERISAKNIYQEVSTRRDLANFKKDSQAFLKRESETITEYKGQLIPKYEKERISRMVRSVQQQKAQKRKELSAEKGNLTLAKETDLRPLNPDKPRTAEEWKKFVYSLEKQYTDKSRLENAVKYKENYLKAIKDVLGEQGKELYDFIDKQDPQDIVDGYTYDETTSIRFAYDKINAKNIAGAALNSWNKFLIEKNKT